MAGQPRTSRKRRAGMTSSSTTTCSHFPAHAPPRPGSERAKALKGARYSLWKNPENLTENQQIKLAWIAATDPRLYRAYLLKEGLRLIFSMPYTAAVEALERWISWARRCRIPSFVKLQKSIVKHKARILAAIKHNLSNGLIESTNTASLRSST